MTTFAGVNGCKFGWVFGSGAFDEIRKNHYVKDVANHDINDAFALLWGAERIYRREAEFIPAGIESDSVGLRIGI